MAIKSKEFISPDKKIKQNLKWEDVDGWIEVTHSINLVSGEGAKFASEKTYPYGDPEWETIRNQYNLDPELHCDITVYKYKHSFSETPGDHVGVFLTPDRPHPLGNVSHQIVGEYSDSGGSTSVVTGEALSNTG